MYRIEPMTSENAKTISMWKYPGEYSIYSFDCKEDTILELMSGEYFSGINIQGNLIGYFCFGFSAQIPTEVNYTSDTDKIDIGLGLLPELCGHGYGKEFMQSGMKYARDILNASGLRLVAAEFNKRAITLYKSCGFAETGNVEHRNNKANFIIMQCTL